MPRSVIHGSVAIHPPRYQRTGDLTDFKLLAALGAWLGWQALPLIILLSSLVGALCGIALILLKGRGREVPIPFGPYLAVAGWIAMIWGDEITSRYLAASGLN